MRALVARPMASDGSPKAEDRPRSFFEHLEEVRARLKVVIVSLLIAFVFFLLFTFQYFVVSGLALWLPVPSLNPQETIANQFLIALRLWLVRPVDGTPIQLVVLTPWEAVVVQFKIALFLAAIAISPVATYEFWRFVSPGLKPKEKSLIMRVSIPVVVLFLAGVAVSLLIVLPFTFPFLYGIAVAIGATPLLQLQEFLDFVLLFTLAFGAAFELPVVMYGLSALGIVQPDFWRRNWRYATIAIFIFGAIITPDGSGVTMMLVSVPMLILYVAGYAMIRLRLKNTTKGKSS